MATSQVEIDALLAPECVSDPDAVRTIDAVLRRNLVSVGIPATPQYVVRRKDQATVTYESIEDVLAERNGRASRILSIRIVAQGGATEVSLTINRATGISLSRE
jgi:hypothetical protein